MLCLAVTATPALAQQVVTACAPRVISEMLDDRFGESEVSLGIAAAGTLNAMENIRYGNVVSEDAQRTVPPAAAMARVAEVAAETEDAIEVLTEGPLDLYPDAVALLEDALELEKRARNTVQPPLRNGLRREAASLKRDASAMMVE